MSEEKKGEIKSEEIDGEDKKGSDVEVDSNKESMENSKEENSKDINWKKFREKREEERKQAEEEGKARKKAEAEAALLKEALKQQVNKGTEEKAESSDWDIDAEYVNKKDLAELVKNQLIEERKRAEAAELPKILRTQMPDFDNVCSQSNVDYFEFHHPEISSALSHMPDSAEKWSLLYRSIKKYLPSAALGGEKDRQKMEANSQKPQSASSAAISQMGNSHTLGNITEAQKRDNWRKMQENIKGGHQ